MVIICFKQHITCKQKQCVHIHHITMHYHIGNVCYVVVHNFHGLIFQIQNQISITTISAPQYILVYINTFNIVMYMVDAIFMETNSVNCVQLIYIQL